MSVFTIDTDNNITLHATRKAARKSGASVFDSAESLAAIIGPDSKRMIDIWNSLTGVNPVRKFASLSVAARRIFTEIQELAGPADQTTETNGGATKTQGKRKAVRRKGQKTATRTLGTDGKPSEPGTKAVSKKEIAIHLIARRNGASLEELMAALGWQKHSVRGFIATLGKIEEIESFKTAEGVRTYRAV